MTDSRKSLRRPNKSPRSPKLEGTRPTAGCHRVVLERRKQFDIGLIARSRKLILFVCQLGPAAAGPVPTPVWLRLRLRHCMLYCATILPRMEYEPSRTILELGCLFADSWERNYDRRLRRRGSKSGDARWALGRLTAARWRRHDPPCSRLHAIWMRGRANLRHVHHVETATRWPRLARYLRSVFCARRR